MIIREHYKAPTLEDVSHKLSGTTLFFYIRCQWWFLVSAKWAPLHHISLHSTHTKGDIDFFIIQSEDVAGCISDVVGPNHKQITRNCSNTGWHMHQWKKTQEQHDKHLLQLVKTAAKLGPIFNSKKCHISQPQITFYRPTFSAQGMKPDPIMIRHYRTFHLHKIKNKLQSFLGLVNYLQPFLPDIATKTTFLWQQVSEWNWNPSTDSSFQKLKQWMLQHTP